MSLETKACSKCKVTKPLSAFYFCGHTQDQAHSQCKDCFKLTQNKKNRDSKALRAAVEAMHKAERDYGCGFYEQDDWIKAYEETARLVGLPERGY